MPPPVRPGVLLLSALICLQAGAATRAQSPPSSSAAASDLDAFMEKVLERRSENWRVLHDYVLDEGETLRVLGPGDVPLHQLRRQFSWYARDGYLVRSPVSANGVAIGEQARRRYETRWLENEKRRERGQKQLEATTDASADPGATKAGDLQDPDVEIGDVMRQGSEPRFISEAYFLEFRFERGNYYLVGREQMDGREVLRIEYYPTRMFGDESRKTPERPAHPRQRGADEDIEDEVQRSMNKVSLVTLWIDPQEYQIVRFTFDNVDFNFLPGRALVRVDEARASMTMGRYFDNVWLPRRIEFDVAATFAAGTYRFAYAREFLDYRRGETSVRVRGYAPKEP